MTLFARNLLLPESQAPVRPPAVVLHSDGVRALLHDGLRVLDVLLAGPQGGACPCGAGSDDPAGDVHHPGQHPELPAPGRLHQGHRRLVRGLRRVRVLSPPGVCSCQLCSKV